MNEKIQRFLKNPFAPLVLILLGPFLIPVMFVVGLFLVVRSRREIDARIERERDR